MNRAAKIVAVAVLALAPTTYLVIAATQSLEGSESKERIAKAAEPLHGRPPAVMRNIYAVPVPEQSWYKRFFETNSWQTSSLYVRFDTTPRDLDRFLRRIGTDRGELVKGVIPITRDQQKAFGWNFHGPWAAEQELAGATLRAERKGGPGYRLVVNLARPERPSVYLVSTVSY